MILESLQSIKALLILDNNGDRVITKYYDDTFTSTKDKQDFEKNLFKKTDKTDYEIIAIQGLTVVYKSCVDLLFYVVGSMEENELILVNTLNTYFDSVSAILRKNVEKKALYEKMEHIILATDEIVEAGVIMEDDADSIVARVYPKLDKDIPLTEQTVAQVYQTAKEGFKWSLLR